MNIDLNKEHKDSYLNDAGEIIWDSAKIAKRLGLATFENPMCLRCKVLPVCTGTCSQ